MGNKSVLYLLKYNNYFNRIVKKEDTIEDYNRFNAIFDNAPLICNFNPNDGINTEHIINIPYIATTPEADYVVVASEEGDILSRWFIVEADRVRGGQYRLALHRDLVVDFYENIITSSAYIERGFCNIGNNLIFNSEGLSVNEIKQNEILLKDGSGCPWIVGYVAENFKKADDTSTGGQDFIVSTSSAGSEPPVLSDFTKEEWEEFSVDGIRRITSIEIGIMGTTGFPYTPKAYRFNIGSKPKYIDLGSSSSYLDDDLINLSFAGSAVGASQGPAALARLQANLENSSKIPNLIFNECEARIRDGVMLRESSFNAAYEESGLVLYDENNQTFKVNVSSYGRSNKTFSLQSGALYDEIKEIIKDSAILNSSTAFPSDPWKIISMTVFTGHYNVTVEPYEIQIASTKLSPSNVQTLKDAPYKMFCIPYPKLEAMNTTLSASNTINPNPSISLNMAMSMIKQLTKGQIYDLQLLPYCPIPELIQPDGGIDLSQLLTSNNGNFTFEQASDNSKMWVSPITIGVTGEGTIVNYILWCESSNFSSFINLPIKVPTTAKEFKIEHETSFYRLVSPNYNGVFQFKATSNNGVDFFKVKCTYKPYVPYIHIAPNFKGLYGADYDDARGLVCGGDFSLPTINDSWVSYQIQNKTYMNSFNRQIENMETVFDINLQQQKTTAKIGTATAAISGATSGAFIGSQIAPGIGTAAGAVVGGIATGVASGYGAAKDLEYAQKLQQESLSYTRDQFDLSLKNIQALPYTLNNISSFDVNYKYFPFLEYFTCTEEEREALSNKIKYRSMTINVIDKIETFIQAEPTFISAQIIRLEDIGEDYHMAAAISNEIHKGVYI